MDTPLIQQQPTKITIPARRQEEDASLSWQDKPVVRRHMADRYRGTEIAGTAAEAQFFGEDGLQVTDVLDVINPLQHIPFVSTLYRELTGDTISSAAKIAGGALLGGPVGLVAAVFDSIFTQETGRGLTETAVAMVTGDTAPAAATTRTQVASAAPDKGFSEAQLVEELYPSGEAEAVATLDAQQKLAAERYASIAAEQSAKHIEIIPPDITVANVTPPASGGPMSAAAQSQAMLDLYGNSPAPAHRAYRDANMLSYLQAASVNTVM